MITFRPIEKADLTLLQYWRNLDQVRSYVREYRLLNNSDQESWYESYLKSRRKSDWDQEIYIIENIGKVNEPIGVGGFTRIEWRNRKAELTFYLGVESKSHLRLKCIEKLIEKGFGEFNFHKITWPVYGHDPNLLLYQTVFDVEAILREEYWWNNRWYGRIYLTKFSSCDTCLSDINRSIPTSKRNLMKLGKKPSG